MTPPDPTNPSPDVEALINALYPVEGQLWISVAAARLAIANWLRTQSPDPTARAGVAGEIERACRALLFDSNDVDPDVAVQAATSTILGFISASPPPPGSGAKTTGSELDTLRRLANDGDRPASECAMLDSAAEEMWKLQASLTAANSRIEAAYYAGFVAGCDGSPDAKDIEIIQQCAKAWAADHPPQSTEPSQ